MRKYSLFRRSLAAAAVAALVTAGCATSAGNEQNPDRRTGSIVISWEFTALEKNGAPYTDAVMVINGNPVSKYPLGLFYGKVNRIHTSEDRIKELEGGTLSGFVTNNGGGGYEVVVRYDENLNRLCVLFREIDGKNFPGTFKALKNIFLPRGRRLDTGF